VSESKETNTFRAFWSGFAASAAIFFGFVVVPFTVPKRFYTDLQQQAVERGCAEWKVIHAHDGTTKFMWLDSPVPVKEPQDSP
jgi:hypothetical protein